MGKIELFDERGKSRGFFDTSNQLNDLTGKEWIFSTKSVIPKTFPPSFHLELRNKHGGQKPPELCEMLIKTFTKEGDAVLDPFAGVGGTLLGCHLANRVGTGIEINRRWVEVYQEICKLEKIKPHRLIHGDSSLILQDLQKESRFFDMILTDVPYWKMDLVEKSKGTYKRVGEPSKGVFSERSKLSAFSDDLGEDAYDKKYWIDLLTRVFMLGHGLLKDNGYCCIFIGNMYNGGEYHLLTADVAEILKRSGFVLKGEIIWYDVSKKLHLYGINYSWIPSIVHQFILVFRKESGNKLTEEQKKMIEEQNIKRIERFRSQKKTGLYSYMTGSND